MIGEEEEQMYHCWASWYSGIWHACAFISSQFRLKFRLKFNLLTFITDERDDMFHMHNLREKSYD